MAGTIVSTNRPEGDVSELAVCVYCGLLYGLRPEFAAAAAELGALLGSRGMNLVYGGGTTGLMGAIARLVIENGGLVHGIIPDALVARERTDQDPKLLVEAFNAKVQQGVEHHNGTTPVPETSEYGYTTVVLDMHTRKRLMAQEARAFVAMPGGYGTLEELMEVVTWLQLGIHHKPIVLFNVDGFYDGFVRFISEAIESGFISKDNGKIIAVATTAAEVVAQIEGYTVPQGRFRLKWLNTSESI